MERKLKVIGFYGKQKLLDYVNTNSSRIDILSISTGQEAFFFQHFLWYYEK
jgi:hypothetical protein